MITKKECKSIKGDWINNSCQITDGEKHIWQVVSPSIKGYVRTGKWYGNWGKLIPATTDKIIQGEIMRSAIGGAIIYDKNKKEVGSVYVEYDNKDIPFELSYGRVGVVAYRIENEIR